MLPFWAILPKAGGPSMATKAGKITTMFTGALERACRAFDVEDAMGDEGAVAMAMQLNLLRGWWSASLLDAGRSGQDAPEGNVAGEQTGHAEDHLLDKLDSVNQDGVSHAA